MLDIEMIAQRVALSLSREQLQRAEDEIGEMLALIGDLPAQGEQNAEGCGVGLAELRQDIALASPASESQGQLITVPRAVAQEDL